MIKVKMNIQHDQGECEVEIDSNEGTVDISQAKGAKLFPRHVKLIQEVIAALKKCENFGIKKRT